MSEPKKLKIKAGSSGNKKKLIVKTPENKAPDLPITPDPEAEAPAPGLKIKNASGEQSKQQQTRGLKIKSASGEQPKQQQTKGLKIKSASGEQPKQQQTRGLKIKSASGEQPKQEAPAQGLKIKSASGEQPKQEAPAPGLKIKSASGAQPKQEAPAPVIKIKKPAGPQLQLPDEKIDLNQTLIPEQMQSPPPVPDGYVPIPTPEPTVNQTPQGGPIFPSQQQNPAAQNPQTFPVNHQEPAPKSQGPIFPTQQPAQNPMQMPAASGKKTSAPLSAIMGEVRAARKIPNKKAASDGAGNVVKMKKPSVTLRDSRGVEFCHIKEGTYYVGLENEITTLAAAYTIGKYPVTKKEYFDFLKETDNDYTSEQLNSLNKISPHSNCPAVLISWEDAKNYCRWLREKTGDYYALPSINEWEIAARGKDGRIYPWGEQEPNSNICCFNDGIMEPQTTASVDYFAENVSPFGCVGMIGNVMEWTLDSFDDERDPHILKGGGWVSPIDFCNNVTPCMSYPPNRRQEFVGLRLLYLPKEIYQKYRDSLTSV